MIVSGHDDPSRLPFAHRRALFENRPLSVALPSLVGDHSDDFAGEAMDSSGGDFVEAAPVVDHSDTGSATDSDPSQNMQTERDLWTLRVSSLQKALLEKDDITTSYCHHAHTLKGQLSDAEVCLL